LMGAEIRTGPPYIRTQSTRNGKPYHRHQSHTIYGGGRAGISRGGSPIRLAPGYADIMGNRRPPRVAINRSREGRHWPSGPGC
jgi:hypothetical protein